MADPSGPRATFFQRFAALLVDAVLLGIVNQVIGVLLEPTGAFLASVAVGIAYYVSLEGGPTGQTLGKRVLGIKVVRTSGGPLGGGVAFLRYLGHIPSSLVFGLGYLWMLWDDERQTWHDKIAATVVVPVEPA